MKATGKLYAAVAAVALAAGLGASGLPAAQAANSTTAVAATQTCNPGDTQPMYRLYNRISREHLYTSDTQERDILSRGDWNYEGVGWIAPAISSTPVYRLYNPYLGDHHYTPDASEVKALTTKHGWKNEGIGWYSDDCHAIEVYRQYNPQFRVGAHNYTTDVTEYNINNARNGWQAEGIAWYAAEKGWGLGPKPSTPTQKPTASPTPSRFATPTETPDPSAPTTVTATEPAFSDQNGTLDDTFTIPSKEGVRYIVNGNDISAGIYAVKDHFTYTDYWANTEITAIAKAGYTLTGTTSWTKKIDGRAEVTPEAITFTDNDGQALDTFTVPSITGVQYKAGGKNVAGGTYAVKDYFTYTNYMANATVTASPKAGYKFPSGTTSSWRETIDDCTTVTTVNPSGVDEYGKKSDTYTIPNVTGVQYKADGTTVEPGTHAVITHGSDGSTTVTITATPKVGYKLTGTTSWSFNYTAIVTPQEVMFYDPYGSASDTVTIPEVEGVYYTIDGVRKAPGTYSVTSQIGPYSNHHREMSVHAYADTGYTLESDSQLYYFHQFTDGQAEQLGWGRRDTKDFGDKTLDEAKQIISDYAEMLASYTRNQANYEDVTALWQIYGGDSPQMDKSNIASQTYGDAEKEVTRRFSLRYEQRMDELRGQLGLDSAPIMWLTDEQEELMFRHAINSTGGHVSDAENVGVVFNQTRNDPGRGFNGSTGAYLENLTWNSAFPDDSPEKLADQAFRSYLSEVKALDVRENEYSNASDGHLQAIISDRIVSSNVSVYFYMNGEMLAVLTPQVMSYKAY